MKISNTTSQYLKDLNSLYQFLPQAYPIIQKEDSVPLFTTLQHCPACGKTVSDYEEKEHDHNQFPYFPSQMKYLFEKIKTYSENLPELNDKIRFYKIQETFYNYIYAVNANHNHNIYGLSQFEKYRQIMEHFKKSPYFNETFLNGFYEKDKENISLPDGIYLETYYCEDCFDDVFISLVFRGRSVRKLPEKEKQKMIEDLSDEQKMYVYTMIARAVAFTYAFSEHTLYLGRSQLSHILKAPYQFFVFPPLLRPTETL